MEKSPSEYVGEYGDKLAQYIIGGFKSYGLESSFGYNSQMFLSKDKYGKFNGYSLETHLYIIHELYDLKKSDKEVLENFIKTLADEFTSSNRIIFDECINPKVKSVEGEIYDEPESYTDWIYGEVDDVIAQFDIKIGTEYVKK